MRVASQGGEAIAGDAFHDKKAVDVLHIKVPFGNCRLGGLTSRGQFMAWLAGLY